MRAFLSASSAVVNMALLVVGLITTLVYSVLILMMRRIGASLTRARGVIALVFLSLYGLLVLLSLAALLLNLLLMLPGIVWTR